MSVARKKREKARGYDILEAFGALEKYLHVWMPIPWVDPAPGHGLQDTITHPWITIGPGDTDIPTDFLALDLDEKSIDVIVSLGPDAGLNAWLQKCCYVAKNIAVLLPVTTLTSAGRREFLIDETPEVLIVGKECKYAWFLFGGWRAPNRWSICAE